MATKHKLGWIGMGRMGYAMAYRLVKGGCDLSVWNRTSSKAEPIAAEGGKVVKKITDLADRDIVFTSLSTTKDVKQVLFDKGGLLTGRIRPKLVVETSSISDDGSAEIREQCEKMRVSYLSAPVSGNAKVVKAGKLWTVASGPKSSFALAEPYLKMFGRGVTYVGSGELARVWKIAHNTMFGTIIQSLCEVTIMAERAGIPRHVFLESINNSVLGSMYTRYKTPALVNLDFAVTFTPKLLLKDMDLGMGAGRKFGVTMPVGAATREAIANVVGRGYEDVDFSVLIVELAKAAGMELQPDNVKVSDGLAES